MTTPQTRWSQFGVLITVFFFWGFVAASNDILIPVFKKAFDLTQAQSQLVSVAFYVAYTVGSILYILASKVSGKDLLHRLGYRNGICLGLAISAVGTLLFYPAANLGSFELMICGLFVVGLGFSLQQIAANPLAIVMGDPRTGAQRLTMAGGVNNLGTTVGPLLVSYAIFGSVASGNTDASIESVKVPYLVLGLAFLLVALMLKFSSVPDRIDPVDATTSGATTSEATASEAHESGKSAHRTSALAYPQLTLGMVAIFVYVGVEVSTISNLPAFLEEHEGIPVSAIAPYVSLYWASLMIGRWTGAAGAFDLSAGRRRLLALLLPYLAFGVFLGVNAAMGHDVSQFYQFVWLIAAMVLVLLASRGNPARNLLYFAVCGIVALTVGMLTSGRVSAVAFTSVGLFCSTMWPCIFALAITGLGRNTNQGSSLLIMMIMGGGIVSWIQGLVADAYGIQISFTVGVACFAYLAFYAWRTGRLLRAQGIDLDRPMAGSGH